MSETLCFGRKAMSGNSSDQAIRYGRMLLVFFMACFIADSAVAQSGDISRYHYVGTLGNTLPIQMDLRTGPDGVSGKYYYESMGAPLELKGKIRSDETAVLDEIDEKGSKTGVFTGKWVPSRKIFEGKWTSAKGQKTLPFHLEQIAEYSFLDTKDGPVKAHTVFPRFLSDSPAMRRINETVRKAAVTHHQEFVGEARENAEPDFPGWEQEYNCSIEYASNDLVSLLGSVWAYTGGAHGNSASFSMNFQIRNNEVKTLNLPDLFVPRSNYLGTLSDYVVGELRKQEASYVMSGEIKSLDQEALSVFFLKPRFMEFIFDPYAVGPYAEGGHSVTVPYSAIKRIINPEGPLGTFLSSD